MGWFTHYEGTQIHIEVTHFPGRPPEEQTEEAVEKLLADYTRSLGVTPPLPLVHNYLKERWVVAVVAFDGTWPREYRWYSRRTRSGSHRTRVDAGPKPWAHTKWGVARHLVEERATDAEAYAELVGRLKANPAIALAMELI